MSLQIRLKIAGWLVFFCPLSVLAGPQAQGMKMYMFDQQQNDDGIKQGMKMYVFDQQTINAEDNPLPAKTIQGSGASKSMKMVVFDGGDAAAPVPIDYGRNIGIPANEQAPVVLDKDAKGQGGNYQSDQPASTQGNQTQKSSGKLKAPLSLYTWTGTEVGGQVSDYRYEEHTSSSPDFMHETGAKVGISAIATLSFYKSLFVSGDLRFAYSSNSYHSPQSGTQDNIPDYLWDTRFLVGKDFLSNDVFSSKLNFSLSPYIGVGYRNLYNDLRGTGSSGSHGYRRGSEYIYLPVGLTHRFLITDKSRINTNLEYDQLLEGWQNSTLSDVSPAYPDIMNRQHRGYGVRASLMYERSSWSVGPYFNYWKIQQSSIAQVGNLVGYEPNNETFEYGLQARWRFWSP